MKTKKFHKNMKFGAELKKKFKRLMGVKKLNTGKTLKKFGSSLMVICHWIDL